MADADLPRPHCAGGGQTRSLGVDYAAQECKARASLREDHLAPLNSCNDLDSMTYDDEDKIANGDIAHICEDIDDELCSSTNPEVNMGV
ncbi:hypothetical protein PR001_g23552 [Phytophthora rubi]|uniref:Uncharacterized protein n=1 Tax=Phytophthora rubi TaxID=129364 RepID=A0A6A3IF30_9STRA|nr:hypothetical protein PR002_g23975 [Phytophthora rubi]KAE8983071.1 hypothetical protein PR001_g23552 [Phytophthora rubi]